MPNPADPMFVFHRIRTEVHRLMYLNSMQDKTLQFIKVLSVMEPRYVEAYQQHMADVHKSLGHPKPPKMTTLQKRSYITGATYYMRRYPRSECEHDEYMLRGWDDRLKSHPDLHQPAAITQESDPVKP